MKYNTQSQIISTVKIKPLQQKRSKTTPTKTTTISPIYLKCECKVDHLAIHSPEQLSTIANCISNYVTKTNTPSLVGLELLLGLDDYKDALHAANDPNLIKLLKQAKKLIAVKWISKLENPEFYLARALGYYEKKELDINIKPPVFNLNLPPEEEQQELKEIINEE